MIFLEGGAMFGLHCFCIGLLLLCSATFFFYLSSSTCLCGCFNTVALGLADNRLLASGIVILRKQK